MKQAPERNAICTWLEMVDDAPRKKGHCVDCLFYSGSIYAEVDFCNEDYEKPVKLKKLKVRCKRWVENNPYEALRVFLERVGLVDKKPKNVYVPTGKPMGISQDDPDFAYEVIHRKYKEEPKNIRYYVTGKEKVYKGAFQEPKKVITAKINWVKRMNDAKD